MIKKDQQGQSAFNKRNPQTTMDSGLPDYDQLNSVMRHIKLAFMI
jgi:hypothetical protein